MNTIAILLSTYNGERYIIDQLLSLEGQSCRDFDLFIGDDGSSDETLVIVDEFLRRSSLSVRILPCNGDLGASQNFAHLLKEALKCDSYRYFMFCDQDDFWLPQKVERTLHAMKEAELSYRETPLLVHSDLEVVDEHLDLIAPSYWAYQKKDPRHDTLNSLLIQNVITGCTVMINRRLAEWAPIPKNIIMHDWWLGLVATSFGEIVTLPESTMQYRQHDRNNIGASAFSISKKLEALVTFSFDKYLLQAQSFLDVCGDRLSHEQREIVEAFISIPSLSWYQRKIILLRYRFSKHNFMRNIGLFLCK